MKEVENCLILYWLLICNKLDLQVIIMIILKIVILQPLEVMLETIMVIITNHIAFDLVVVSYILFVNTLLVTIFVLSTSLIFKMSGVSLFISKNVCQTLDVTGNK